MIVPKEAAEQGPAAVARLNEILKTLNLQNPNPKGIFSKACTIENLIQKAGNADESLELLGKRILLLLECRPVYGDEQFESCIQAVFHHYSTLLENEPTKEFVYLLNDLIRYFRSICVNYQSNFLRESDKWAIRNVKLRHSRLIMYGGLLLLLGEVSRQPAENKLEWLLSHLPLTPLDRMACVYRESGDQNFFRVAGFYNVFHAKLSDKNIRAGLNLDYKERYENPTFSELKANSDGLIAELMRFVFSQRGT